MKNQLGFVHLIVLAGLLFASGAVGYSVFNAEQHPEVSKAGRK